MDKTPYLVCPPQQVAGPPGSLHVSIIPPTESACVLAFPYHPTGHPDPKLSFQETDF